MLRLENIYQMDLLVTLVERNERGDKLVEFCSRNNLRFMNTFLKLHPRRLYTWRSPDKLLETKLIIFYARLDGKSV